MVWADEASPFNGAQVKPFLTKTKGFVMPWKIEGGEGCYAVLQEIAATWLALASPAQS